MIARNYKREHVFCNGSQLLRLLLLHSSWSGACPHPLRPHSYAHTHTHTHNTQENLDSALFHFSQLLERRPRHYEALAQLIGLLRR